MESMIVAGAAGDATLLTTDVDERGHRIAGGSTSTLVLAGSTAEDRFPTGAPPVRTASIAAARSRR